MIAAMHEAHPAVSIRRLCELARTGRSWYYACPPSAVRAARDSALRDAIARLVLAFPGYGYRRVTKVLQRDGWDVNPKRVLRIIRHDALVCQLQRRFVRTTDATHPLRTYPNLLANAVPSGSDQAWVADITYIRLPTTFAYLACVLDAWSRRCVGWEFSRAITTTPHPDGA